MPALYAHKRFGDAVAARLSDEVKEVIQKHPLQFRIGLQGPDPFFFYRPIIKTHVTALASEMHEENADAFFKKARKVIRKKGLQSREYAFILGFICHFTLDSECHPYVNEMAEEIGVGHMEIEGEFEKYLLRKDKKDALRHPIASLIPTDIATVKAFKSFFPEISEAEVKESLITYRIIKHVFTAPSKYKQAVINAMLKIAGIYKKYYGLMHTYQDNELCQVTNEALDERMKNAVSVAVELIQNYDRSVRTGEALVERFKRTYD